MKTLCTRSESGQRGGCMQLEDQCLFSLRVISDRISRTKYFFLCKTDWSVTLVVHYLSCWTTRESSIALELYIFEAL